MTPQFPQPFYGGLLSFLPSVGMLMYFWKCRAQVATGTPKPELWHYILSSVLSLYFWGIGWFGLGFLTDSGRRGISGVVLCIDFYAFLLPWVCFCILHIGLVNLISVSDNAPSGAEQSKYLKWLLFFNLIILSAIPAHCGRLLLMYPCVWKLCRDSSKS